MVISSNFSSPDVRSKRSNGKPVATPNMAADSATPVPANADNRNPPISQARDPGSEEIVQKGQQFLDAASSQSAAPADVNDDEEVKASGVHDQPAVHSNRIRGEERSFLQATLSAQHQGRDRVRDPLGERTSLEGKSYRLQAFAKGKAAAARLARAALQKVIVTICGRDVGIAEAVLTSPDRFMEWLRKEVALLLLQPAVKAGEITNDAAEQLIGCIEASSPEFHAMCIPEAVREMSNHPAFSATFVKCAKIFAHWQMWQLQESADLEVMVDLCETPHARLAPAKVMELLRSAGLEVRSAMAVTTPWLPKKREGQFLAQVADSPRLLEAIGDAGVRVGGEPDGTNSIWLRILPRSAAEEVRLTYRVTGIPDFNPGSLASVTASFRRAFAIPDEDQGTVRVLVAQTAGGAATAESVTVVLRSPEVLKTYVKHAASSPARALSHWAFPRPPGSAVQSGAVLESVNGSQTCRVCHSWSHQRCNPPPRGGCGNPVCFGPPHPKFSCPNRDPCAACESTQCKGGSACPAVMAKAICVFCGVPGHLQYACPTKAAGACFHCGLTSHSRSHCPYKEVLACLRCQGRHKRRNCAFRDRMERLSQPNGLGIRTDSGLYDYEAKVRNGEVEAPAPARQILRRAGGTSPPARADAQAAASPPPPSPPGPTGGALSRSAPKSNGSSFGAAAKPHVGGARDTPTAKRHKHAPAGPSAERATSAAAAGGGSLPPSGNPSSSTGAQTSSMEVEALPPPGGGVAKARPQVRPSPRNPSVKRSQEDMRKKGSGGSEACVAASQPKPRPTGADQGSQKGDMEEEAVEVIDDDDEFTPNPPPESGEGAAAVDEPRRLGCAPPPSISRVDSSSLQLALQQEEPVWLRSARARLDSLAGKLSEEQCAALRPWFDRLPQRDQIKWAASASFEAEARAGTETWLAEAAADEARRRDQRREDGGWESDGGASPMRSASPASPRCRASLSPGY